MPKTKLTLKEALLKGKLKQFIKEREGEKGDLDKFDKIIESATGTSSTVRSASSQDDDGS